ncbi:hypothetical protein ANN_12905 [Periplaneta americana]|uniref:Uncharacterized protein n=1 Tax=Periplaneta americana TaxID=6978 RepID=A0ABQ8TJ91_PERAM|nr:hypothetical protein ANN_12905 [Periplaneta americana]
MEILHIQPKSQQLNTLEQYCDSDVRFELTTSVPQDSRSRGALRDGARRREERGVYYVNATRGECARSCYLRSKGGRTLPNLLEKSVRSGDSQIIREVVLSRNCGSSGRQQSLKCAMGTRCRPVCPVVQQREIESIPASSYESTMVHCVFRGLFCMFKDVGLTDMTSLTVRDVLGYITNRAVLASSDIEPMRSVTHIYISIYLITYYLNLIQDPIYSHSSLTVIVNSTFQKYVRVFSDERAFNIESFSHRLFFKVDGIGDIGMVFGEMRPRIRHGPPDIRPTLLENFGKKPNQIISLSSNRTYAREQLRISRHTCYCLSYAGGLYSLPSVFNYNTDYELNVYCVQL